MTFLGLSTSSSLLQVLLATPGDDNDDGGDSYCFIMVYLLLVLVKCLENFLYVNPPKKPSRLEIIIYILANTLGFRINS